MENHSAKLAQDQQLDGSSAKKQAHRDDLFPVAATLRAEVERNLLASFQSQTDALAGLLKLELLFGQTPTPPDSVQPAKPPASGWRSMASAPGQHVPVLLKREDGAAVVARRIGTMDLWHEQGCLDGYDWCGEYIAWAPIPEWTGEVAD